MKIAVYSIAKNEENFVKRWHNSAKEADGIFLLDTGSNDKTVEIAESLGIKTQITLVNPWRFDLARNASLEMIPEDYDWCIALDLDEVLVAGWREHLENLKKEVTRPRYTYTWSWESPGVPSLQYGGDKIHLRKNYTWKHPVHEVIYPVNIKEVHGWCPLEIHHFPDSTKSRKQYFPLLELAVKEDPENDRNSHYLAREYFSYQMFDKAEKEFKRHLRLKSAKWGPERAQSCRYLYKITNDISWLHQAIKEAPDRREGWVELAQHHYNQGEWKDCLDYSLQALKIKEKPMEYLTESFAWGSTPHDLAAISAYNLGYFYEARHHGIEALKISPEDERLSTNYYFYNKAINDYR
jgi:glycosyltransferase involved in cell wall biosynthesis